MGREISGWELLSYIENHVMETVDWKEDETFEDILTDILSGKYPPFIRRLQKKQLYYQRKNIHQEVSGKPSRRW